MNHSAPERLGRDPVRPLSVNELRGIFENTLDRQPQPQRPPPIPAPAAAEPDAAVAPSAPETALAMSELTALDDQAFLDRAYQAILHRTADETGIRHYLSALRSGDSRIRILGELRYSPEGRVIGCVVPGLRRRFLIHRFYRLPILGRLIRTATALLALPGLMRDVMRLSVDLHTLRTQMEQADHAVTDEVTRASQSLAEKMAQAHQGLEARIRTWTEYAERAVDRAQKARHHQAQRLDELADRFDRLAGRLDEEPWADPLLSLAERSDDRFADHASRLQRLAHDVAGSTCDRQAVAALAETFAAFRQERGWTGDGQALAQQLSALLTEHRNLARHALTASEETRVGLRDQERRLSLMLEETRRWMEHGLEADAPAKLEEVHAQMLDPLYLAFEDRFRGSRADIKQRQRVYLGLLQEVTAIRSGRPIVDVGSGRGELLELLGEAGLDARGVDLNRSMVALCVQAGLNCVLDDAVSYLSKLDAGSLGAVTGFHIIEHLPFASFVALLDASLRALAPGGIVIFETPNPANLLVSSRWFHLDPTHRSPLPSEMVSMIAEARGFVQVGIRELHPMPQRFAAKDDVLAAELDAMFHGPQDYALIARKA